MTQAAKLARIAHAKRLVQQENSAIWIQQSWRRRAARIRMLKMREEVAKALKLLGAI